MYKLLNNTNTILKIADELFISAVEGNPEYQRYLAWLAEGNTPEPADIPPVVIPTITMRQARLALLGAGLLDEIEAAITTPENRIWWDYSTTVERNHPLVCSVLDSLGKSAGEIDALFVEAAGL